MIYTLTLNPSLDYIVDVNDVTLGATNRTVSEAMYPGGKGINVSIVLNNLGLQTCALGFLAGFVGREIAARLDAMHMDTDFVWVNDGCSRINAKIRSTQETEINGMGPKVNEDAVSQLLAKLDKLGESDTLVLSGAAPANLPPTIYSQIMARLQGRGVQFVVDACNDLLMNALPYAPMLIKPNIHELEEMFCARLESTEEIVACAEKLREKGARNVIVSMGGDGAVAVTEQGVFSSGCPKGTLVNSVGAGDSMVAGFVAGCVRGIGPEEAFRMAVCAGSASAFSELLATKEQVDDLMRVHEIRKEKE